MRLACYTVCLAGALGCIGSRQTPVLVTNKTPRTIQVGFRERPGERFVLSEEVESGATKEIARHFVMRTSRYYGQVLVATKGEPPYIIQLSPRSSDGRSTVAVIEEIWTAPVQPRER